MDDLGFGGGIGNAWIPIGSLLGFLGIRGPLTSDPCSRPICGCNCSVSECVPCETCCIPAVELEVSREGVAASVIIGRGTF
uniref:Uncharacterized protein n=1 Tax=Arundo donax TaxID=35708 RepID=A0A0A8ZXD0_ARUDO